MKFLIIFLRSETVALGKTLGIAQCSTLSYSESSHLEQYFVLDLNIMTVCDSELTFYCFKRRIVSYLTCFIEDKIVVLDLPIMD